MNLGKKKFKNVEKRDREVVFTYNSETFKKVGLAIPCSEIKHVFFKS